MFDREKSRLGFALSGGLCSVNGSLECGASCQVVGPDYSLSSIFTPLVIGLAAASGLVLLIVVYLIVRSCCCNRLQSLRVRFYVDLTLCSRAGAGIRHQFRRSGNVCLARMQFRDLDPCLCSSADARANANVLKVTRTRILPVCMVHSYTVLMTGALQSSPYTLKLLNLFRGLELLDSAI